jgi:hypothetical protein
MSSVLAALPGWNIHFAYPVRDTWPSMPGIPGMNTLAFSGKIIVYSGKSGMHDDV